MNHYIRAILASATVGLFASKVGVLILNLPEFDRRRYLIGGVACLVASFLYLSVARWRWRRQAASAREDERAQVRSLERRLLRTEIIAWTMTFLCLMLFSFLVGVTRIERERRAREAGRYESGTSPDPSESAPILFTARDRVESGRDARGQ